MSHKTKKKKGASGEVGGYPSITGYAEFTFMRVNSQWKKGLLT